MPILKKLLMAAWPIVAMWFVSTTFWPLSSVLIAFLSAFIASC